MKILIDNGHGRETAGKCSQTFFKRLGDDRKRELPHSPPLQNMRD